jgi:hypothetical protein
VGLTVDFVHGDLGEYAINVIFRKPIGGIDGDEPSMRID